MGFQPLYRMLNGQTENGMKTINYNWFCKNHFNHRNYLNPTRTPFVMFLQEKMDISVEYWPDWSFSRGEEKARPQQADEWMPPSPPERSCSIFNRSWIELLRALPGSSSFWISIRFSIFPSVNSSKDWAWSTGCGVVVVVVVIVVVVVGLVKSW